MRSFIHKQKTLKGFTIAELLVVLALTSVAVTLSYGTLTYIQKLFAQYRAQNRFLNEITSLKARLDRESLSCDLIVEQADNRFDLKQKGRSIQMELNETTILLKQEERCDTFHIRGKKLAKLYEPMSNPAWQNRLINSLQFETEYMKQAFNIRLHKAYNASVKLELEQNSKAGWQY